MPMPQEPPPLATTAARPASAPGWLWFVILGTVGFAAGFFGPIIFVPEANQGPLVGILITGPGGAVLGLGLFLAFKFLPASARVQWWLLTILSVAITVATLLVVQPGPARLGTVVEVEIGTLRTPAQAADEVIGHWQRRIAEVTWAEARPGWQADMRRTLAEEPGAVIEGVVVRQRRILELRKPWNRGRLVATAWEEVREPQSYYLAPVHLGGLTAGMQASLFVPNDSLDGVKAPAAWPPHEFARIILRAQARPVPAAYAALR